MKLERVVIEAGDDTFTLDLHPRVTVVAGIRRVERSSLIGELVGALGGSRPGVHLEIEERSGRHLAVFRPTSGRHRVVDVDRVQDVTASMADEAGDCDLLAAIGLDTAEARRIMCAGPADLATATDASRSVERLAAADQKHLWAAAEELVRANEGVATEATAIGTSIEDFELIDEIENRQFDLERAAQKLDGTRRRTFRIAGASGVATLPGVLIADTPGLGFLGVAILSVVASLSAWSNLKRAERAATAALAEAGANTYLGFQLQRVNSLLGEPSDRTLIRGVANQRRDALAAWTAVAGDAPVDWAIAHREEIQTAARLRREVDNLGMLSASGPDVTTEETDDLARALVARLAEARSAAGEGLPLILDEPFTDLAAPVKTMLLELLSHTGGEPQIIVLTEDDEVASWARLETLTGDVALIEPDLVAASVEI